MYFCNPQVVIHNHQNTVSTSVFLQKVLMVDLYLLKCLLCSIKTVGGGCRESPQQVFNYILMWVVGGELSPPLQKQHCTWNALKVSISTTEKCLNRISLLRASPHDLFINSNINLILWEQSVKAAHRGIMIFYTTVTTLTTTQPEHPYFICTFILSEPKCTARTASRRHCVEYRHAQRKCWRGSGLSDSAALRNNVKSICFLLRCRVKEVDCAITFWQGSLCVSEVQEVWHKKKNKKKSQLRSFGSSKTELGFCAFVTTRGQS